MKTKYIFLSIVFLLSIRLNAQTTRYVTVNGTTSAANATNATTWATACNDLQAVILASGSGDTVWVAQGTYLPIRRANSLTTIDSNNRDNAFVLKANVHIYGGFAGSETNLSQRNWNNNPTILSGDIGTLNNSNDNCYHVVISSGNVGTACLDGFTITKGNANTTSGSITVNGSSIERSAGGGILCYSSSLQLFNINITENSASHSGGGIANKNNASPILKNVIISKNTARYGGGMYNINLCSPILTNVIIINNKANVDAGGIYNHSSSSPILTNVIIIKNTAVNLGGGINNNNSEPILTNVTICKNTCSNSGGGINNYYSRLHIRNSILWDNTKGAGLISNIENEMQSVFFYDSVLVGGATIGNGIILNTDPMFVDTANGDYRLLSGSPCINAGNNAFYHPDSTPNLSHITTDLDGNSRIYNTTIDLGAYEFPLELNYIALSPEANDTDVALNAVVSVTFNQNIAACGDLSAISISPDPGNVSTSISDSILSIDHADFNPETVYTVNIPANTIDGYDQAISWQFTTIDSLVGDTISFDWSGMTGRNFTITATSGKKYLVDWGNGKSEIYVGTGSSQINILSGAYENTDTHTVHIYAFKGCSFTYLDVSNKSVTRLDVSRAAELQTLFCYANSLNNLDVSNNTALGKLFCYGNTLNVLDVSNNTALEYLSCNNTNLSNLDISNNTALIEFRCHNNNLNNLNVSNNTALEQLHCHNNNLSSLDVSNNTVLDDLSCYNNNLDSLNLSNNTLLVNFNCDSNRLPLSDLYAASGIITDSTKKCLGTQIYTSRSAKTEQPFSLANQMILRGTQTAFLVMLNGNPATQNVDYSLDYLTENITFHTSGNFELRLTNTAISSHGDYPAQLIIPVVCDLSDDATLLSLTVNEGTLSPAFNPLATDYTLLLCNSNQPLSLSVVAVANHPNATVSGDGMHLIAFGKDTIVVSVTAENGDTIKDYSIFVELNQSYQTPITEISICQGDQYWFGGQYLTTTGIYVDTLQSTSGCDSIITLSLTVNPLYNQNDAITICSDELPYRYGNREFAVGTVSGDYTINLTSVNGCDSVITLSLTVSESVVVEKILSICENELPYTYGDSILTKAGFYRISTKNMYGCDSTINLVLEVLLKPANPGTIKREKTDIPDVYAYYVESVISATLYKWEISNPLWTIVSTIGTRIHLYIPKGSGSGTVSLVVENDCGSSLSSSIKVEAQTSIVEAEGEKVVLEQNIPNPASTMTRIPYTLPEDGTIVFKLMSGNGQILHTQEINGFAGKQYLELDIQRYSNGIYFYSMEYKGRTAIKKMDIQR